MSTALMPPMVQARQALTAIADDVEAALDTADPSLLRVLLLAIHLNSTHALEVLPEVFAGRDGT